MLMDMMDRPEFIHEVMSFFEEGHRRELQQLIDMLVQEEPANEYDKNMLGMASYIGIEKGKRFDPDPHTLEILERRNPRRSSCERVDRDPAIQTNEPSHQTVGLTLIAT